MKKKNTWGGAREGAGAPSTVGEEGRRKVRGITLNDSEFALLKLKAQKAGLSTSEFIRRELDLNP